MWQRIAANDVFSFSKINNNIVTYPVCLNILFFPLSVHYWYSWDHYMRNRHTVFILYEDTHSFTTIVSTNSYQAKIVQWMYSQIPKF